MNTPLQSVSIDKYPSTAHLEGSRLQKGDEDKNQVPWRHVAGCTIVIEEKLDGANSGVRFLQEQLLLQSRGHYLTGGGREKHFAQLKTWAAVHEERLKSILGERYLMYGEWMAAKHTVFYDQLPHLFFEFDIFDTHTGTFLDTATRLSLLQGTPVMSVPVLYRGVAPKHLKDILTLIQPSLGKSVDWKETLKDTATRLGLDVERIVRETEKSDLSEGLYVKVEKDGKVIERLKWVRADFVQTMTDNDSHWQSRPIVPNQLMEGADLYAPTPTVGWPNQPAIAPALAVGRKGRHP
jgi:hypothetical protein